MPDTPLTPAEVAELRGLLKVIAPFAPFYGPEGKFLSSPQAQERLLNITFPAILAAAERAARLEGEVEQLRADESRLAAIRGDLRAAELEQHGWHGVVVPWWTWNES